MTTETQLEPEQKLHALLESEFGKLLYFETFGTGKPGFIEVEIAFVRRSDSKRVWFRSGFSLDFLNELPGNSVAADYILSLVRRTTKIQ